MSTTPGERLREERKRLGFNQEQFGALGGVRKQAQIKYEKGERKPDSKYFEGIAAAGANVDYILTGTQKAVRRALNDLSAATEMAKMLASNPEELSKLQEGLFETLRRAEAARDDEEALLHHYRNCAPEDQEQIQKLAERLAQPQKKTDIDH